MTEDNIIQYYDENKTIYFAGNITSFVFYNQLFNALREHYKKNGVSVAPIFSFIHVVSFDPLVVPNLISLGFLLKDIHKKPIHLEIASTKATKFLDNGWFFKAVGQKNMFSEEFDFDIDGSGLRRTIQQENGYGIYDFEKKRLGFYDFLNVSKPYNQDHRVHVFREDSYRYYSKFIQDNTTEEELGKIRTNKCTELEPFVKNRFKDVLYDNDKPILNEEDAQVVLDIITELITNAVLYSGSHCSAMLQRIGNVIKMSISDYGVGFEYSFEKKKEKFKKEYKDVFNEFNTVEQEKYKNYIYIFETLSYSKKKEESTDRENLFTLLKIILKKQGKRVIQNGTIRIHYKNTQVIMTSNTCSECNITFDPKECAKCLLRKYSPTMAVAKSNLRFFDGIFNGVHIEVELKF